MIGGHVGHSFTSQSVKANAVFRYLWPPTFVNLGQLQLILFELVWSGCSIARSRSRLRDFWDFLPPPPGLFCLKLF
ncbi:hypothetical protein FVEG_05099 [Fusarium verticillioides 7600]|uniref:Uncharacterized protein n=1 Tax=Gibberella moniliformis (strain M3125 / FGSC 7600) TaxID=334819 RepID=W7LWU5_GIBM7|nr:hypothetical protein FVEG_05099 [Fusarium verticillioides 7600]EWG43758.1 hypothetical protein FVEG_05099 [Fusarium verticillioides 7600]